MKKSSSHSSSALVEQIHSRALDIATHYKKTEGDLIDILEKVDVHRVFISLGYSSLFQYVVSELKLSESAAYHFITVARKCREVPTLKTEIRQGTISLSHAKKIAPVLNFHNSKEWLLKAATLSRKQLEKEIVKVRPEAATPERVSYVTETRMKLELGLFEKDLEALKRVQDLLSQKLKKSATLEDVLIEMTKDYLKRYDPVKKAERSSGRKVNEQNENEAESSRGSNFQNKTAQLAIAPLETLAADTVPLETVPPCESLSTSVKRLEPVLVHKREPLHALVIHQVNLRDQRKCTYRNQAGKRCAQSRWTEVHHLIPIHQGGNNDLSNLTTLCSAHHRWVHQKTATKR